MEQPLPDSNEAGSQVGDELKFLEQRVALRFSSVQKLWPCSLARPVTLGSQVFEIPVPSNTVIILSTSKQKVSRKHLWEASSLLFPSTDENVEI